MSHFDHAFANYNPLVREGLTLLSRRNMLKAGLAGMAGLSLPELLRQRALLSWAQLKSGRGLVRDQRVGSWGRGLIVI